MVLLKNDMVDKKPLREHHFLVCSYRASGECCNAGDRGSSNVRNPEVVTLFRGIEVALLEAKVSLSNPEDIAKAVEAASKAGVSIVVVVGYNAGDEREYIIPSTEDNPELLRLFPPPDGSAEAKAWAARAGKQTGKEISISAAGMGTGGDRASIRLHL